MIRRASPAAVILAMCAAEVMGMTAFSTFPALLPTFTAEWGLSNTAAGWIGGVYFVGYLLAVPVLVTLTDRVDPRRIYLAAMALSALSALGFAVAANGVVSASIWRGLQGRSRLSTTQS